MVGGYMGLINKTVQLENNYDKWKKMFEEEKNTLNKIFNNESFIIEHVGSTAVKDLLAKPIVDIVIGLNSFDDIDNYKDKLKKIYTLKENIDKKEILLIKENEKETFFLIHLLLVNDKRYQDMIKFRNILNSNKKILKEYEDLKIKLSRKYANDRKMYTQSKNNFITNILKNTNN